MLYLPHDYKTIHCFGILLNSTGRSEAWENYMPTCKSLLACINKTIMISFSLVGKKALLLKGPLGPHLDGLMRGNRKNDLVLPSKEEFRETLSQLCPEENIILCRSSTPQPLGHSSLLLKVLIKKWVMKGMSIWSLGFFKIQFPGLILGDFYSVHLWLGSGNRYLKKKIFQDIWQMSLVWEPLA